jgi:hypothetical protein
MFRKTLLTTTAITALATAGIAGAAEAPVVSAQSFTAGNAVVTVPGTGVKQGEWIGKRGVLVHRSVTLEGDQRVDVTLTARKGQKIRGLAHDEGTKISFQPVTRSYVGKQKVVVRARVAPTAGDGEVTNRVYALSR